MVEARPVPIAFSAAGFKALPYERPPVLPLQGLVLLMGTNSAGKSSLLLALRLLASSLLHEPSLERLHLRAPGIPDGRLTHVEDLLHRVGASAADADGDGLVTFRIVFGDHTMLELVYALGAEGRDRREGMGRPVAPLTLRRVRAEAPSIFRAVGDPADPWSDGWQPAGEAAEGMAEAELLASLGEWSDQAAFLDSIREEQQGPERRSVGNWVDSGSVLPRGGNAASLYALVTDGGLGIPDELPVRSDGPLCGHTWILPDGARAVATQQFADQPDPAPSPDDLSALLGCCGLSPLVVHDFGPGHPTELRTEKERVGLADLGDGQRQVLPALVQALLSERGTTLCWEHPDLHLHPGGATGLGRIAYRLACLGRSVLIETHSRDLVAGVQSEAAAVRVACSRDPEVPLAPAPATLLYLLATDGGLETQSYALHDARTRVPMWPGFVDLQQIEQQQFEESLGPVPLDVDAAWLRALLARGEGDRVEWKASLSWNLAEERSDRLATGRVMRAIAALCNTHGGILVVGVDDAGQIVGWDPTIPDGDTFQQQLANLVERDFGTGWYAEHLHVEAVSVDSNQVAVVQCVAADRPVHLWDKAKQRRVLPVRVGSTCRDLPVEQEAEWVERWFRGGSGSDGS